MNDTEHDSADSEVAAEDRVDDRIADEPPGEQRPREIGGRKGPEPIRYGDWEKNGRCIDF